MTLPSDAVHEWTDPLPALASDPPGDPSWDPLLLPDLKPKPDEPDKLEQLPLDARSDAELPPVEEEPDRKR